MTAALLTVESACLYLETLAGKVRFLGLYQKLFPSEYEKSTASTLRPEGRYSPKEEEFLNLVDSRLFSLPMMAYDPDFGSTNILPVYAMGVGDDCGCGEIHVDGYLEVWQVALVLVGQADIEDTTLPQEWKEALQKLLYSGNPRIERLTPLLEEHVGDDLHETGHPEDAPILHLPLVCDVAVGDTGNLFYDFRGNEMNNFTWCEEDIKLFSSDWADCLEMETKLDAFAEWLMREGERAIQTLVNIWNRLGQMGELDMLEIYDPAYAYEDALPINIEIEAEDEPYNSGE